MVSSRSSSSGERGESLAFAIHGGGFTRLLRGLVLEGRWDAALRIAESSGAPAGVPLEVLKGSMRFKSPGRKPSWSLVALPESARERRKYERQQAVAFAGRVHETLDGVDAWWRVVAVCVGRPPFRAFPGVGERVFELDEPLENGVRAVVLVPCVAPPPWVTPARSVLDAFTGMVKLGLKPDVRLQFTRQEYLDELRSREEVAQDEFYEFAMEGFEGEDEGPAHQRAVASFLNAVKRPELAERVMREGVASIVAPGEFDEESARAEVVRQAGPRDGEGWVVLGGVLVPREPFLVWASSGLHKSSWRPVSPYGMKTVGDDAHHTDWLLGAGVLLGEYDDESPLMRAAWEYRSRFMLEEHGEEATVLAGRGSIVSGTAWHPSSWSDEPPPDAVAVLPGAGVKWGPLVGKVRAFIVEEGGALAHLVKVSREWRGVPVVRVPGARALFPAGSRVMVDAATGRVGQA